LVNGKNIARSNRKEYGNSNKCSGFDREVDIFRDSLKSDDLSPTAMPLYLFAVIGTQVKSEIGNFDFQNSSDTSAKPV